MKISALKMIFITYLIFQGSAVNGKKSLEVRQQEVIIGATGQSVTIPCSVIYDSKAYTVTWTRGCSHRVALADQTCYNGRMNKSDGETTSITPDSGTKCCERYHTLTITNLTENDSGIYCCHMQTINGDEGHGNGTRLEVTPRTCESGNPWNGLWLLIPHIVLHTFSLLLMSFILKKLF